METNPEKNTTIGETQEFSMADFKEEQERFLQTCSADMREGYEKNYLARLNNFTAFLPVNGSPYRRMVEMMGSSTSTDVLRYKQIFATIDTYLANKGIDLTKMSAEEVKNKMPDTLIDLYIELRRLGFTRDELTK